MKKIQIFCISWVLLFAAGWAEAATRTVHFSQVGRNRTTQGLGEPARSTCRITISNPSSVSQNITFNWDVRAEGVGSGPAAPSPNTNSVTLSANGGSQVWLFSYNEYPDNTTVEDGSQELICSGTIVASDPTGSNPGFVIASGVLTTFVESGEVQTENATGASVFGGFAVYTQVPITINRGSPF